MRGIFAWRQNQGGIPLPGGGFRRFNGMPGLSDIAGVLPDGKALYIECKWGKAVMSETQKEFQRRIAQNNAVAVCVWSVDELAADLKELGY